MTVEEHIFTCWIISFRTTSTYRSERRFAMTYLEAAITESGTLHSCIDNAEGALGASHQFWCSIWQRDFQHDYTRFINIAHALRKASCGYAICIYGDIPWEGAWERMRLRWAMFDQTL